VLKRAFDIAVASALLVLLAPLMLIVAILVLATMGRPVLFAQTRPGRGARAFPIYKFRTMRDDCDADGRPLPDGARLTSLGRALRSSSLDELPELFNVLRGDMSLVGPRPLLMEYLPLYTPEQARRHAVRPGVTGWAQVNGRNAISWERKFAYDVWYVDHASFTLDLRILAMTLVNVLSARGINQEGQATAERFRGGSE
jgi:lipopolysaccharide/colanic/teichoic acid biosynthesis glycosyltransferase